MTLNLKLAASLVTQFENDVYNPHQMHRLSASLRARNILNVWQNSALQTPTQSLARFAPQWPAHLLLDVLYAMLKLCLLYLPSLRACGCAGKVLRHASTCSCTVPSPLWPQSAP